MQSSKNLATRATKDIPDYTGDGFWAKQLAQRLEQYYHQQGHTKVKCWAEIEPVQGDRKKKLWGVRSNITFDIANMKAKCN